MDYLIEKYLSEKLKDRKDIKEDIGRMILSLKEESSYTSKEQKDFFIKEIEKVREVSQNSNEKTFVGIVENFNYFKDEIMKKLEEKDQTIKELLEAQQILIKQQEEMRLKEEAKLQSVQPEVFKEESVKEEKIKVVTDIISEPIDQLKILEELTKDKLNKFKYTLTSNTDLKQHVLNHTDTDLNRVKLERKFIESIKGGKISVPRRNFIQVKDLTLENMNPEEVEYSKNILDLQLNFQQFRNEVDLKLAKNIDKTIKQTGNVFQDLINQTNNHIDKITTDMKVTDELLHHIKTKVDKEFNEQVIKSHFDKMSRCTDEMAEKYAEMKSQSLAFNRERMIQIEEDNKKTNQEIDAALKKLNIDPEYDTFLDEENPNENKHLQPTLSNSSRTDSNVELTDGKLDELYNQYKEQPKKQQPQRMNYQYVNPPTANYKFGKQKLARPTVGSKNKK